METQPSMDDPDSSSNLMMVIASYLFYTFRPEYEVSGVEYFRPAAANLLTIIRDNGFEIVPSITLDETSQSLISAFCRLNHSDPVGEGAKLLLATGANRALVRLNAARLDANKEKE